MQKRFLILVLTEANENLSAHSYETFLVQSLLFSCIDYCDDGYSDLTSDLSAKPQRLQTCAYVLNIWPIDFNSLTLTTTTTHVHVKDRTSLSPFISKKLFSQLFTVFTGNDLPGNIKVFLNVNNFKLLFPYSGIRSRLPTIEDTLWCQFRGLVVDYTGLLFTAVTRLPGRFKHMGYSAMTPLALRSHQLMLHPDRVPISLLLRQARGGCGGILKPRHHTGGTNVNIVKILLLKDVIYVDMKVVIACSVQHRRHSTVISAILFSCIDVLHRQKKCKGNVCRSSGVQCNYCSKTFAKTSRTRQQDAISTSYNMHPCVVISLHITMLLLLLLMMMMMMMMMMWMMMWMMDGDHGGGGGGSSTAARGGGGGGGGRGVAAAARGSGGRGCGGRGRGGGAVATAARGSGGGGSGGRGCGDRGGGAVATAARGGGGVVVVAVVVVIVVVEVVAVEAVVVVVVVGGGSSDGGDDCDGDGDGGGGGEMVYQSNSLESCLYENENIMHMILLNTGAETPVQKPRKRKRRPETWKRNVAKKARHHPKGFPVKLSCGHGIKGSFQWHRLSMHDVRRIHQKYYANADLESNKNYILQHVAFSSAKINRLPEGQSRRHVSNLCYSLPRNVQGITKHVKVCRKAFLGVLNESRDRVQRLCQKYLQLGVTPSETRGGVRQVETCELKRTAVKEFVKTFQPIQSHYCRGKNTVRQYLSSQLNVKENVLNEFFRTVFNENFNISLDIQLQYADKFSTCMSLENKINYERDKTVKHNLQIELLAHKKKRTGTSYQKLRVKSDSELVLTYDCQKNLIQPKLPDQEEYYKRQMYLFNFTIFEGILNSFQNKNNTYIYKMLTLKAQTKLASSLHHRLNKLNLDEVTTIRLFSDGCGGQNKNQTIIGMLSHWMLHSSCFQLSFIHIYSLTGYLEIWIDTSDMKVLLRTLKRISSDWKLYSQEILKPHGKWRFQFQKTKKIVLTKSGKIILVHGEPFYNFDPKLFPKRIPNVVRGVRMKDAKIKDKWEENTKLSFYIQVIQQQTSAVPTTARNDNDDAEEMDYFELMYDEGSRVSERLACLSPSNANQIRFTLASLPDFRMWYRDCTRRCRWSAGFLGDLPFIPPFLSYAALYSPCFTLIVETRAQGRCGEAVTHVPTDLSLCFGTGEGVLGRNYAIATCRWYLPLTRECNSSRRGKVEGKSAFRRDTQVLHAFPFQSASTS
ncbi:hypothetical protein PR048_017219 [Dryococelus australis]|uniref:Uncharacterized protein n=1 Tax=Dryococelus australis TaxID=614101 RepID=A0ABQ9H8X7_9NEOP|nr:hypothetical protein PR048_017219 [Dryococelus australis]